MSIEQPTSDQDTTDVEAIVKLVEQALKDGSADAALEEGREARQRAMDALARAERIDPLRLLTVIDI